MINDFTDEQLTLFDKLTKLQRNVALMRLANPKWSDAECYRQGGGTAKTNLSIATSASEIINNPNVVAFIDSFKTERLKKTIMTRDELLEDLSLIARANVFDVVDMVYSDDALMNMTTGDVVSVGENSVTLKKLTDFKPEFKKLVKSIKPSKYGLVIELHDPMAARKMIAELQGFDAPKKHEITGAGGGPLQTHELSDDEFADHLASIGLNIDDD